MRLTVTSHLTLDGVMQSNGKPEPERSDGFEQGGWQVPYFDQDLDRLTADWIACAAPSCWDAGRTSCSRSTGRRSPTPATRGPPG
jgi:hypothetical protein